MKQFVCFSGPEVNFAAQLESACVPNGILIGYNTQKPLEDELACDLAGRPLANKKQDELAKALEIYPLLGGRKKNSRSQKYS